jgi:DNA-binding response OmpR family regulator
MADDNADSFKKDIKDIINERQQISYNELSGIAFSRGVAEEKLKGYLSELEQSKGIASRSSGGILTYYLLEPDQFRKVIVVEDDKNINKLMALSIGKGYEISQIYDGGEAITAIREKRPELVILDLMLPHKDGLDICQTIKSDPQLSSTIVILVSAMDPTSNRFKGLKYGADYYIKKPFDPSELRSLVTLFLKKKGKRFDPLIDLPDEERISNQLESSIKQGERSCIGTLRIDNLGTYTRKFGERPGIVLLRLVSQLLQDAIKGGEQNTFVGFLNSDEFVIAGLKDNVDSVVKEVRQEFTAVLPFIFQDAGYKKLDLDMEALFESEEVPKLALVFTESEKEKLKERRNEVLKSKGTAGNGGIGTYTYDELQKIFGKEDLEIIIKRDSSGVRLKVGKRPEDENEKE